MCKTCKKRCKPLCGVTESKVSKSAGTVCFNVTNQNSTMLICEMKQY